MQNYKIMYAISAENDLKDIALYIAINNSVEVAYKIVDDIEKKVLQLETMPFSGFPEEFNYVKKSKYRFLVVHNYLIHYHVDTAKNAVYIDRIRHGAISPENQI